MELRAWQLNYKFFIHIFKEGPSTPGKAVSVERSILVNKYLILTSSGKCCNRLKIQVTAGAPYVYAETARWDR